MSERENERKNREQQEQWRYNDSYLWEFPDTILELVRKWREVAQEQTDPFLKFIVEYIAFNALFRAKYGNKETERNIIGKLKKHSYRGF